MRRDRPPHWHWPLDRWVLLVTALLAASVLALALGDFGRAEPAEIPQPAPTAQPNAATASAQMAVEQPTSAAAEPAVSWPPNGGRVGSTAPCIAGRAFPGATVRILDGDVLVGEVVADSLGRWSVRPGAALLPGQHTIVVEATSPDSQTTLRSAPVTFIVPG